MDGKDLWDPGRFISPTVWFIRRKNILWKKCSDYEEAQPQMIETNDSVDFYWDPV